MPDELCLHGNLILPDAVLADGYLIIRSGKIAAIEQEKPHKWPGPIIETGDGYVSPGFIDIHVHGGDGSDYMDGTVEAVRTANRAHLRHGTTTIFPTTTTGSTKQLDRMIRACLDLQAQWSIGDGARIGGIHFYGPYFAADKVGCHSREGRRNPAPDEYR
jgi:N-acetylglucosamine-6-phosphate deacetylase